jgi:hypothetical protein
MVDIKKYCITQVRDNVLELSSIIMAQAWTNDRGPRFTNTDEEHTTASSAQLLQTSSGSYSLPTEKLLVTTVKDG